MGIDKILANIKGKDFLGVAPEGNSKPSRKNSRRKQKKMSKVQKLYEVCKEVFADCGPGIIPAADDIERLKSVLDGITATDLGVNPIMPYFGRAATEQVQRITYMHLHECDKFSIGIFCLPPSGIIPLHNHPGMTVFSKLLFGTMHIKSYDWAADTSTDGAMKPSEVRLAKIKVDADFSAPCNTNILYPTDGGNLHCFTAMTPCAVLDVLGPPYSDPDGRHCTYYLDYPLSSLSVDGVTVPEEEKESYVWLKEKEKYEGLVMIGAAYPGPKIKVVEK